MHYATFWLITTITIGMLWSIYTQVCTICSFLHTTLPPWDFLNDFPKAQALYKVFIYVVGYVALNGRSTVYKSIAVPNGGAKPATTPSPSK